MNVKMSQFQGTFDFIPYVYFYSWRKGFLTKAVRTFVLVYVKRVLSTLFFIGIRKTIEE